MAFFFPHPLRKLSLAGVSALTLAAASSAQAVNLVQNGDFEISTPINLTTFPTSAGGIGQIGNVVNLPNWLKTCILDCAGSEGFAFVINDSADNRLAPASSNSYPNQGGGFPSKFSPGASTNIFLWGPDNQVDTSNNGFTGSGSGAKFIGIDGDFGRSKISQTISTFDTSKQYVLSFQYAGAQFTDGFGPTTQQWKVTLGGNDYSTTTWNNPDKGFTPWATYASLPFTPGSTSADLEFEAIGTPQGSTLPPFLLLDNVQILEYTPPGPGPGPGPGPNPVPGPLPVLGVGVAYSWSRRLRQRIRGRA